MKTIVVLLFLITGSFCYGQSSFYAPQFPLCVSDGAGGISCPQGTIAGAVPYFTAAVLNLKAFGAVGNGTMSGTTVSGTDDTAAVQA